MLPFSRGAYGAVERLRAAVHTVDGSIPIPGRPSITSGAANCIVGVWEISAAVLQVPTTSHRTGHKRSQCFYDSRMNQMHVASHKRRLISVDNFILYPVSNSASDEDHDNENTF